MIYLITQYMTIKILLHTFVKCLDQCCIKLIDAQGLTRPHNSHLLHVYIIDEQMIINVLDKTDR